MAPRPGRVVADLAVPPPAARDEEYRTAPGYIAGCRAVSAALKRAMQDA